jgi:hypothetical protein
VEKKVKPVAGPLPADSEQKRKEVSGDPTLRCRETDVSHVQLKLNWEKIKIG